MYRRFMISTVFAAFTGSSGSSQPAGFPVSTEQNLQARVQTEPINIIVAVPLFQHSPMFGQWDSSQTVDRLCFRTTSRRTWYLGPLGNLARNQEGFLNSVSVGLSFVLIPSLIAENPISVRNFFPLRVESFILR